MNAYPSLRFGVIGIDHRHVFDRVRSLLAMGAECADYWTDDRDARAQAGFVERFPGIARVAEAQHRPREFPHESRPALQGPGMNRRRPAQSTSSIISTTSSGRIA